MMKFNRGESQFFLTSHIAYYFSVLLNADKISLLTIFMYNIILLKISTFLFFYISY